MVQNDLIIIPEKIVIMAQKLGAEHSEVCLIDGKQLSINIEESNIVKTESKSLTGVGLRVLHKKAIGLASSTQFNTKILESMTKDAVSLAKVGNPDPNNTDFAQPDTYPIVKNLYNQKLASLTSEELVKIAVQGLDSALDVDQSFNTEGNVNLTIISKIIANSNGVNISCENTFMQIFLNCQITKGEDIGTGFDFAFGRTLNEVKPEKVGRTAGEKALSMLGGQKIETGNYPFLLDQRASRQTINRILSEGVSAYNIIQGIAFFNDRLGEEIASPNLTVIDNPLQPGGYGSRFFDDEGTPCKKIAIVKNGTLLSYLSDVYSSKKLDIPNTGSAGKPSFDGIPHPSISVLQIKEGLSSKDELFGELNTGIYMESPLVSIQGTNISQQVDAGYWVEKGEIKFPVKNTMLGATVYDVLKSIKLVGKDILIEGKMKSPMLLFGPSKFSSGK